MWPRLGPIPTYSILYSIGILSHYLISCLLARRLGLRHRVWIVISVCYNLGMIVGAKALYDIQHTQFDFKALLSIRHYMQGGLWGGLLPYLCLSVPLVLVLSKRRRAALDACLTAAAMGKNAPCPGRLHFPKVPEVLRRAFHCTQHRFTRYSSSYVFLSSLRY